MDDVDSFADLDLNEEVVADVSPAGVTPRFVPRAASPGTSPLFSSPASTMSGLTGGVGGGNVTPIYCRVISEWCGGAIKGSARGSTGDRFCCKLADECTTQSHRTQKVAIREGTLYLQGPRVGQARLEPSVKIDQLPLEVPLDQILGMQKPYDVMIAYFSSIAFEIKSEKKPRGDSGSNLSSPGSWTPINLAEVDLMEEASKMMQSPTKLKMGPFLAKMADSAPMGSPKLQPMSPVQLDGIGKPTPNEQTLFLIQSGWNNLINNVTSLKEKMDVDNEGERIFRDALGSTISELQSTIDLTDGKVKIMSARVGDLPSEAVDQTSTVWEALRRVRSDLGVTSKLLIDGTEEFKARAIQVDTNKANLKKLETLLNTSTLRLTNLGKSYSNLAASYMKQVRSINLKLATLESKVGDGPYTDGLQRGDASAAFRVDSFDFSSSGDWANAREALEALTAKVDHLAGSTNQHVGRDAFDHLVTDVRSLERQVHSGGGGDSNSSFFQAQLDTLSDKIKSMDDTSSDGAVVLPNHTFMTYRDLRKFVENEEIVSVGAFWDLFSVLVCMTPKEQSGQERANEQHASSRINTTTFENDLAAAMSHEKPRTLYGSAKLKEGFGAIKSHAEWSDVADCIKDMLTTNLENYIEGVEGTLVGSKSGTVLARDLLVKVAFQWNRLCNHIDKFYKELTTVSNFSPKTAHLLIGRSSHAIWTAMRPFRTRIAMLENLQTLDNKAAFIWGVLQCHRVMDEFISFKFQSHPAFVKEMSLFVLTERVDPTQIATVDATVASLRTTVHEMKSKTLHMEDKYGILKRNYDNLVNDVKMLKQASPSKKRKKKRYGAASGVDEDDSE
jgi:hypothetical protein